MRRDPTIHVKHSSLVKVLETLGLPASLAMDILREGYKYRILDRHIIQMKGKSGKKAAKAVEAGSVLPEQFMAMLTQERMKANHQNTKPIRQGSPEYIMLKEVAQLAGDFVDHYEIKPKEYGIRTYIQAGLTLMGRTYSLNRFKTYNKRICAKYEALYAIDSDTDKEGTQAFHYHWQAAMQKYAGLSDDLITNIESYVCMLYGRLDADDNDAAYTDWIAAQFEGLAFLDAIPNPSQFFGDNARVRYEEYVKKMNIKKRKVNQYNYRDERTRDQITKFKANMEG